MQDLILELLEMGRHLKKLIINRCEQCYNCDIYDRFCNLTEHRLEDLTKIPKDCPLGSGYKQYTKKEFVYDKSSVRNLFSYNLRRLMLEQDMSIGDISQKLDMPRDTVRRWRHSSFPCDEYVYYLTLALDCSYHDFFLNETIKV